MAHQDVHARQIAARANGARIGCRQLIEQFRFDATFHVRPLSLSPRHADQAAVVNSMVSAVNPGPNDMAQPLRPRAPERKSFSMTNITVADDMFP